ncbi:MAG: SMC-Scp complex subunit ScpB [Inquilinus limosus]|uniref:SMC-Scp complex subunit ScpB n=1 Tax=Inquilinus limosus TaxID=171674 RepID=A0A952FRF8_9PROT|nr:SMC-Scp complex subunit ScpB [Inquilinus limosus]
MTGSPLVRRSALASTFVATLELAKSGRLAIRQDGPFGPIWLKAQTVQNRGRGVALMPVAGGWAFRTALDLAPLLRDAGHVVRRLTRAALETLAIIAYHQPVTRPEIEAVRGVAVAKGTLDTLLEAGWIAPGRRRQQPGRPLTWITTQGFLDHFGLAGLEDLPSVDELKASGLLDPRPAMAVLPGGTLSGEDGPEPPEDDDRE